MWLDAARRRAGDTSARATSGAASFVAPGTRYREPLIFVTNKLPHKNATDASTNAMV
jgi:hypothetical protein